MTRVARRYSLVVAAVCLIYGTSLLHPPRLNGLEPLTTIAIGDSLMNTVLSLFDSGADPTAEAVFQNRELILENSKLLSQLHERFDNFGKAMETILNKIDDLPGIIRRDLKEAFAEFQQAHVLARISLIIEDFAIMRAGSFLLTR